MAGSDPAASVVDAALDALQPVVQDLWREPSAAAADRCVLVLLVQRQSKGCTSRIPAELPLKRL